MPFPPHFHEEQENVSESLRMRSYFCNCSSIDRGKCASIWFSSLHLLPAQSIYDRLWLSETNWNCNMALCIQSQCDCVWCILLQPTHEPSTSTMTHNVCTWPATYWTGAEHRARRTSTSALCKTVNIINFYVYRIFFHSFSTFYLKSWNDNNNDCVPNWLKSQEWTMVIRTQPLRHAHRRYVCGAIQCM